MLTLGQYLALAQFREVDAFLNLLLLFTLDREGYKRLIDKTEDVYFKGNGKEAAQNGMLSHMAFLGLLLSLVKSDSDKDSGVRDAVVRTLIKRAIEWSLIGELPQNATASYMLNERQIKALASLGVLKNVLIDRPEYLVEKYKSSVVAIHVEKEGSPYVGSGFLILHRGTTSARQIIVTAKHNVDPHDRITIEKIDNAYGVEIPSAQLYWHLHQTIDLAIAEMPLQFSEHLLQFSALAPVLSETITLGFPRIPTSDGLFLLAHKGEINANVTSYLRPGRFLLISNAVSPGNSGSPVLSRSGLVVGMVTDAFESTEKFGILRMQAALEANEVIEFLNTEFP